MRPQFKTEFVRVISEREISAERSEYTTCDVTGKLNAESARIQGTKELSVSKTQTTT